MSIKLLVNNKAIYDCYLEELDTMIERDRKQLEVATDIIQIHKLQGSLYTLRKLKNLREVVNGRD